MALAAQSDLHGVRVLVVDDDGETRDAIVALLGYAGATTRAAGTMSEALDAITAWSPDVLVSDICMPDGDGLALIRQLRARPASQGGALAAVAITGLEARDADELVRAGYQCSLKKPLDPDALLATLTAITQPDGAAAPRRNGHARNGATADPPLALARDTLAHDLRQPLFAMRIWLRLLEDEVEATLSPEGRNHLAQLRKSIAWMSDLLGRDLTR
jgi:CheY-like chemotaxis protein